jgi:O-antigen ligase
MKKISRFTYSFVFLLITSLITLCFWTFHWENIGIPLFLGLIFIVFVFFKDPMPTIPLLLNALFMVSKTPTSFAEIPLYLYLTPVAIIGGMIIHIIRFHVKFLKGKMLLGVLLMFAAMLLSSFNAAELSLNYWFYASIGLVYAIIYLFFVNTIDGNHIKYLLQLLFLLGIIVSFEVLIYYIRVEDVIDAIDNRSIDIGWGISTYIGTYLVMFTAMTFYFIRTSKLGHLLIPLAIFQIIMVLFTTSRGGMVTMAAMLPIFIFVAFYKSGKFWKGILIFLLSIGIITILVLYQNELFIALFDRFNRILFDDSGRVDIWLDAWEKFRENPLFGGGIFARTGDKDYNMFHNTFMHTLGTMGLVGLVSLFIQLFMQFKITLGRLKTENIFLAISLLGAHVHGMVDNVYFMPQFMVIMLIIVVVVEVSEPKVLIN